jgi:hypothetical protein
MTRKCQNWLESYLQYTLPRSESPQTIIYWAGLFTLSSLLRRRVRISREYLGSWDCYPNMYIMLIGEQGQIKKSTTIGYGETLLSHITPPLHQCPEAVTTPDLLRRIRDAEESSVYIISSEFSTFANKIGIEGFGILTDIYDGKKKIDEGTISRGYIFAEAPCLNFIAATTPTWIRENLTEGILGGGFGSRVITITESEVRQRRLIYKGKVNLKTIEELELDLVHDLKHIEENVRGDFQMDESVYLWLDDWYQKNCNPPKGSDPKLRGFYNRRPAHVMKVAMLLQLSESDELVLTKERLEQAITEVNSIIPKVERTFKAIGKNIYQVDLRNMLEFVKTKGSATRAEILETFSPDAELSKIDEILTTLIQMVKIKPNGEEGYDYIGG